MIELLLIALAAGGIYYIARGATYSSAWPTGDGKKVDWESKELTPYVDWSSGTKVVVDTKNEKNLEAWSIPDCVGEKKVVNGKTVSARCVPEAELDALELSYVDGLHNAVASFLTFTNSQSKILNGQVLGMLRDDTGVRHIGVRVLDTLPEGPVVGSVLDLVDSQLSGLQPGAMTNGWVPVDAPKAASPKTASVGTVATFRAAYGTTNATIANVSVRIVADDGTYLKAIYVGDPIAFVSGPTDVHPPVNGAEFVLTAKNLV